MQMNFTERLSRVHYILTVTLLKVEKALIIISKMLFIREKLQLNYE